MCGFLSRSFAPLPAEALFEFREKRYGFVAVRLSDYAALAHPISASWDTLAMSAADFRRLARPLDELLGLEGTTGRSAPSGIRGEIVLANPSITQVSFSRTTSPSGR